MSGSGDTTLKVWDAQTGQETLTLKGHSGTVESVSFSPDGKRIVSGGWYNSAGICRSANRDRISPGYRYNFLGFRVLRSSIK